jgi:hypothetical protein
MTTRLPKPSRLVLALALAGFTLAPDGRAEAQVAPGAGALVSTRGGARTPYFPPAGGWAQVLTATDKWLVLLNEDGQQFPVSYDSVNLFAMRWPISPLALTPNDLVEVTGINMGTNQVAADHVDIYRGAARNLVQPTYQHIIGYNRILTPFDMEEQQLLGQNLRFWLLPGEEFLPARIHVVGPALNSAPVQVGTYGNNLLTVINGAGVPDMTEVTQGVPSYVRPGDLAYVVPVPQRATTRSLAISELVVYKDVPVEVFAR